MLTESQKQKLELLLALIGELHGEGAKAPLSNQKNSSRQGNLNAWS